MESQSSDELFDSLTLSLAPGVGPKIQASLLQRFGSAGAVLSQSSASLRSISGIGDRVVEGLRNPALRQSASAMLAQCQNSGVELLASNESAYPCRLTEICDAPVLLYAKGKLQPQDDLAIAVVGSRRCTAYGRRQAEKLAGGLARAGFTIISGLARGIDGAAHRGALNAGGRTIAVLATGVRDIYPPEHADLAMDITQQGALISEFPLDQVGRPGLFPQRNRIISGMCLGTIVVEAARNSGALYTARHAQEQGREVFAVPGQVDSLASAGCHELIRDGVTLIRNVDDVIAELGPLAQPATSEPDVTIRNPRELTLNPLETEVLNLVSTSATHIDELLRATQLPSSRVLSTLTVLEMKRFVRRLPGSHFVRPN
jgi:DNA processing protein